MSAPRATRGAALCAVIPPITTQGTIKSNPKADKGQANAEAKRVEARDDKATKDAEKVADKAEKGADRKAHSEPKALLKGITLTEAQGTTVKAIEKKYDGQLKDLEKQAKTLEKAGTPDAAFVAKIDALRMQESPIPPSCRQK